MITFAQAQDNLHTLCAAWRDQQMIQPESISLASSPGRYLSEDVSAMLDLPVADVSAMDGYAIATLPPTDLSNEEAQDVSAVNGPCYVVRGESRAGQPYSGSPLENGECVRIFTGAVVPESADTVVIQENVDREAETIRIVEQTAFGANIRRRGEEIALGATIAKTGQRVTPNMIPLLASQGIPHVSVRPRLRVAFFATGDELKRPGDVLGEGDIYESNLASIQAVLENYPLDLINLGVIDDTPQATTDALQRAANGADIVISSGGVSVGDYDYVRDCVAAMGQVTDYKVAMKPGKPVCFGRLDQDSGGQALFFGLPGNAVSSFVVLTELYLPAITYLMSGDKEGTHGYVRAILTEDLNRRPGRLEFQRGVLQSALDGKHRPVWQVRALGSQDSHRVMGLALANCTIQIPAEVGHLPAGSDVVVSVFPWSEIR